MANKTKSLFFHTFAVVGMALFAGCSTPWTGSGAFQLRTTGDVGTQIHVVTSYDGKILADTHISVPSILDFPGRDMDIVCTQEGKLGQVRVGVFRSGRKVALAEISETGSLIEIGIRGKDVSVVSKSRGVAENMKSKGGS